MSTRVFQYGVSDDADVLDVLAQRVAMREAFNERALTWAKARGFDNAFLDLWGNRLNVAGLPGKPEGFGQWKRAGVRDRHVPYKNNAAEQGAMRAVGADLPAIPGLPTMVTSTSNGFGEHYWMQPRPFTQGGRAWFGLGHMPDPAAARADEIGEQWQECKASEFYAALEAYNAERGA